jgi:3-hydroxyacyl-CoA dehydrogenase
MDTMLTLDLARLDAHRTKPDFTPVVSLSAVGDVAVLSIANGPLNILSASVRRGLLEALDKVDADPRFSVAILRGTGSQFVMGADLRELGNAIQSPDLPNVCAAIERCRVPVIAALHGTTCGAGLELALACDGRVCASGASISLPQVTLGGIPGGGATQRLPRIVGRTMAAQIICSGRWLLAAEAFTLGIVDAIADGDLIAQTIEHAKASVPFKRCVRDLPVPLESEQEFAEMAASLRIGGRGRPQVDAALQAIAASALMPVDAAFILESRLFDKLRTSDDARALRYQHFARRRAAAPTSALAQAKKIRRAGVVGAGPMGIHVAGWLCEAGIEVIVVETDGKALQRATKLLKNKGVGFSNELKSLADCDFVIEAVGEDYDVKVGVFIALDELLMHDCIVATSSAYVDVDALASATGRADRICGLHCLPSAQDAAVVEVIRSRESSQATLATVYTLVRQFGKQSVAAGNAFGFIGNRLISSLIRQCDTMVLEGIPTQQIDNALEVFGFDKNAYSKLAVKGAPLSVHQLPAIGGPHENPQIIHRAMLAMANEAACILEDGVAASPSDIDVLLVGAYGFPGWQGGPCFWARQRDLASLAHARDQLFPVGTAHSRKGDLALLVAGHHST